MGESYDYVLCPVFVYFKEFTVVNNASDDPVHVIGFVWIVRNNVIQCICHSSRRIICRLERGLLPVVGRKETEDGLHDRDAFFFILSGEMSYSAFNSVYAGSA
mgnify:CR=1 FL=1